MVKISNKRRRKNTDSCSDDANQRDTSTSICGCQNIAKSTKPNCHSINQGTNPA